MGKSKQKIWFCCNKYVSSTKVAASIFYGNQQIELFCRGQTVPFLMLILPFAYDLHNLSFCQQRLGSS